MADPKRSEVLHPDTGLTLGILEAVERDHSVSQRKMAVELDIALGLVNVYVRRCVKKGLVKVRQVPRGRFAYYLTPRGFAEKSRLTASYLSHSFGFFRAARLDCTAAMAEAAANGWYRIVLLGASDAAEIAVVCAAEGSVTIVGVVESSTRADPLCRAACVR